MSLVLDCSMSLTWCLPGQGNPLSNLCLLEGQKEQVWVPDIWHLEMANILGLKHRDRNLSASDLERALNLLAVLPIETSGAVEPGSLITNLRRVARHQIAAYDAIYVELALATSSRLATFDRAMIKAAQKAGVRVFALN